MKRPLAASGPVTDTRVDAIFVNYGGGGVFKVVPSQAELAFQAALAQLPRSGGVLHVAPGTAPYVFQSEVVVGLPDVCIEFAGGPPGTGLAFPARGGPEQLLRVTAPRFRCRGAVVRHAALQGGGGSDDGRSCFLIDGAGGAAFTGCRFELEQAHPEIQGFSAVRAEGASARAPIEGLRLAECTFLIRPGVRSSASSGAGEPRGVVGLRARHVDGLHVEACIARGEQSGPTHLHCGSVIYLDHCPGAVITDCSVRFLDLGTSEPSREADPAVRMTTHDGLDGHRSVVARALFEDVGTRCAIQLRDARSVVVAHANFGRLVPFSRSVIEVLGTQSRGLVVHGVNFHNVSGSQLVPPPAQFPMLELANLAAGTFAGNVFAAFDEKHSYVRAAPDQCSAIVLGTASSRRAKSGGLTPQ